MIRRWRDGVDVGQLRHLVILEDPGDPVPDGDGGFTEVWTPLTPSYMRAAINPATARDLERMVANTVQATATHIITMRYHPGVTTKTRILFGTRQFAVTGIQNTQERNVELVLACEEVIA